MGKLKLLPINLLILIVILIDTSSAIEVPVIIDYDDDTMGPIITVQYFGDYTDNNPGYLLVSAEDPSGLYIDPSGMYYLENRLGMHDFVFVAVDNDFDDNNPEDRSTTTLEVSIIISDDDTSVEIENLEIKVNFKEIIITFEDVDPSTINSCDWVKVDEEMISFEFDAETNQIKFNNNWSLDCGIHGVEFQLSDGDNDRLNENDAASAIYYLQFEITKDLCKEEILETIDKLRQEVKSDMPSECWRQNGRSKNEKKRIHPERKEKTNLQKAMLNKIEALERLVNEDSYRCACNKLRDDIRPKLTGEKQFPPCKCQDKCHHNPCSRYFRNAWVICKERQEDYRLICDQILQGLHYIILI